jgi:predicted DCC family thiol-disulfide oxidoreductase YuxK
MILTPPDSDPPSRAVMIWDGDCSFCRRWIRRWRRWTAGMIDDEPYQQAAGRFARIPPGDFVRAVHLVEPDGRTTRGAEAALRSLEIAGRAGWLIRAYRRIPLFARTCELAYRFVARHRAGFDRMERALVRVKG